MVRGLAKVAAASGLAAALATPLTLSVLADTPSVPAPVSAAAGTVAGTVNTLLAPVVSAAPAPVSGFVAALADPPGQAPNGFASADAVSITPLDTCISCTSADAGPGTADADSTAIRVLGHDIAAGDASGNSQTAGALIALPANPLLGLAIAHWMASAQSSDTASSAASRASLVDLSLGPNGQVATLAVLEAGSNASWNATSSSGSAYSNGANLNLGQGALVIIVLHSDADSSSNGSHTYVASINGNEILSNTQVGQPITITIPGVITITLLQTSAGGGAASAAVGTVTNFLGMGGQQLGLFQVAAKGSGAPASNPGSSVQAASTSETGEVGVPETGVALGMIGFVLAVGGAAAAVASRISRRHNKA